MSESRSIGTVGLAVPEPDQAGKDAPAPDPALAEAVLADGPLASDLLVEEISIDGMCGVY